MSSLAADLRPGPGALAPPAAHTFRVPDERFRRASKSVPIAPPFTEYRLDDQVKVSRVTTPRIINRKRELLQRLNNLAIRINDDQEQPRGVEQRLQHAQARHDHALLDLGHRRRRHTGADCQFPLAHPGAPPRPPDQPGDRNAARWWFCFWFRCHTVTLRILSTITQEDASRREALFRESASWEEAEQGKWGPGAQIRGVGLGYGRGMSNWIVRDDLGGTGPRVAVKDIIDMAGLPTSAACRAVAERAEPAVADAPCLAGLRAALARGKVRFAGKTNLHELAFGISGINAAFGTPVNPLDPALVPGGSSSGSAVAVGSGEADVAYGSDTGGSIRIPAACCGIAGLKTTWGRIPLTGVWPVAPSLDTVGPMARDVAGLVAGMGLLEPGFTVSAEIPRVVGRLALDADPVVDAAV